jgi:hypothetical protein
MTYEEAKVKEVTSYLTEKLIANEISSKELWECYEELQMYKYENKIIPNWRITNESEC